MLEMITIEDSVRILTLRARCLERKPRVLHWTADPRHEVRALQASEGEPSWQIRRGMLSRDLLSWIPFEIDDLELLAGRLAPDRPEWIEGRAEAAAWLHENYPHLYPPGGNGHAELDLQRLFDLGIDGLRADLECRQAVALARAGGQEAKSRVELFQSFSLALEGLQAMILRGAETAREAALQAQTGRREELAEIETVCRVVAHQPPQTFREAIQLTWFAILACNYAEHANLISPGKIDRSLLPFYEADRVMGRITVEGARLLVESFYLQINENISDGLPLAVSLGGRSPDGSDASSELTMICVNALERVKLMNPTVGVCWHEGMRADLVNRTVELIARGYTNLAFFGDEIIQRGLVYYGVPIEEACRYTNSTCVEITPSGSSNVWVASPYYPVARFLVDELEEQVNGVPARTFDAFLARYRARLGREIDAGAAEQNRLRLERRIYGGKPLQSLLTADCLDRGLDIDMGGARYNWVECSFVGLANLVDSLVVIQREVYDQQRITLSILLDLLRTDFSGQESERQRFLHRHPKYGNDAAEVDGLFVAVTAMIREECARQRIEPDGSPYVPGMFCWIMHEQLGRVCGATPDGRRAGFPFADGSGGAQGREMRGPTAAILSVTSWDASPFIGGAAFNMKFNAALFKSQDELNSLRDLILTYLRRGGFEVQINVMDHSRLIEARQNPEKFRDLVVRIGGYTDYFVRLSPQMQEEIISRATYATF